MIDSIGNPSGSVVVKIGEGDFVLGSDWMPDDDFADVVELIPIFIEVA